MTNHPNRQKVRDWPKFLKEFRARHGFTQKSLADKLMISYRVLENWEQGNSTPPPYLSSALKSVEQLIK